MTNRIFNVAFRCHAGVEAEWEAYGIDVPVYGSGKSLAETRLDVTSGFALHFDIDPGVIELNEFHEHCVYPETDDSEAVWVRTYQDSDPERMCRRRDVRDAIENTLRDKPSYLNTFRNGTASTGDIIATVCFEDDMLMDLLAQVGDTDRIFVCVPYPDGLYWQCLNTPEATNRHVAEEIAVRDLKLGDAATVGDFMEATNASPSNPGSYLLTAA